VCARDRTQSYNSGLSSASFTAHSNSPSTSPSHILLTGRSNFSLQTLTHSVIYLNTLPEQSPIFGHFLPLVAFAREFPGGGNFRDWYQRRESSLANIVDRSSDPSIFHSSCFLPLYNLFFSFGFCFVCYLIFAMSPMPATIYNYRFIYLCHDIECFMN
jgi:hypothetical protein